MICNLFYICQKIKRQFIAPIHPKLEIRQNKVAYINELGGKRKNDTTTRKRTT